MEPDFNGNTLQLDQMPNWDSARVMQLIITLEDTFDIEFETDDIQGLTTYLGGIEILKRYGIEM